MGKLGFASFGLSRDQALGHLAMLAFSALVAGSFSLGSMAAPHIDPAALNAARFWLGAGVLSGIALATGRFDRRAFVAPWRFAILGGLFGIYFVMMFQGLKTAPPVSAAAVFTLTPIVTGLAAWILLRQVMTPRIAAALAIGGAGAIWVIFRADLNAILNFQIGKGEITYFWGCVSHAIYTPMVRKLNRGENPIIFTVGMLVAGGIILSIYGGPAILSTDWTALPPIVWITLAYITIFASAASFVLLQVGSLRLPSSKVMAYTYLTPTWVMCWEIALGRTPPPVAVLLGIGVSIVALLMLLRD